MPTPPAPDRETIRALDAMRSAAPRPATPTADVVQSPNRCLGCGYPLLPESGLRCSECGLEHGVETLKRWYDGRERERLDRLRWLIRAWFILQLALLPALLDLFWLPAVSVAAAVQWALVGWIFFVATAGRWRAFPAMFAIGGMHVALILTIATMRDLTQQYPGNLGGVTFNGLAVAAAGLLLLALDEPVGRGRLALADWMRRWGFALLAIAAGMIASYPLLWWKLLQAGAPNALAAVGWTLAENLPPFALALAAWWLAYRLIGRRRRMLFGGTHKS
jgi:hypothetical protein